MYQKCKHIIGINFFALIWIFTFAFLIQLKPAFSFEGDDITYLNAAELLYTEFKLDNIRPMLVSIFFGLPFLFGFSSSVVVKWGLLLNIIVWFLSINIFYKTLRIVFNTKKSLILSLGLILCVGNLAHALRFLSETIFIFSLLLSFYFLIKFSKSLKHQHLTISIAILFCNSLIKPVSLGLAIILLIYHIRHFEKVIFNRWSTFLVISVALVLFQMYSLKKTYGDFTVSYISSITYYNYLGAKADCYSKNIDYFPGKNKRTQIFYKYDAHNSKIIADKDLLYQLQYNKANLIKAYLSDLYSNSYKGNYIVSQCKNKDNTSYFDFFRFLFKAISKSQNIFFTCFGVLYSFWVFTLKHTKYVYKISALFILYIFFISGISCNEADRFHIAFFPFVIVLLAKFDSENNRFKRFFAPLQK